MVITLLEGLLEHSLCLEVAAKSLVSDSLSVVSCRVDVLLVWSSVEALPESLYICSKGSLAVLYDILVHCFYRCLRIKFLYGETLLEVIHAVTRLDFHF